MEKKTSRGRKRSGSANSPKSSRLLTDFTILNCLGGGGFGVVFKVECKETGTQSAVKITPVIDSPFGGQSAKKSVEELLKEPEKLKSIGIHPNVIKYEGNWEDIFSLEESQALRSKIPGGEEFVCARGKFGLARNGPLSAVCIRMELCNEPLSRWLKRRQILPVNPELSLDIFLQLVKGLQHVHKNNIIHRDFKPANIFLAGQDNKTIKIGDFGYAAMHQNGEYVHSVNAGAENYRAPEQGSQHYGRPVDLYALGLVFYQLLFPEAQSDIGKALQEVRYSQGEWLKQKKMRIIYKNVNLVEIVEKLIQYVPENRMSLDEILNLFEPPETKPKLTKEDELLARMLGQVEMDPDKKLCKHYQRFCLLVCPQEDCERIVPCRFCHDENVYGHKLDRFNVKWIVCMCCGKKQRPSAKCRFCDIIFAEYVCLICNLYDGSELAHDLNFHCDQCGICRRKLDAKLVYFHCTYCGICVPSSHNDEDCKFNAGKEKCKVCNEDIFSSKEHPVCLPCGHYVHIMCLEKFPEGQKNCPSCGKW